MIIAGAVDHHCRNTKRNIAAVNVPPLSVASTSARCMITSSSDLLDRCPHCGKPLPLDHDTRQVFCSYKCSRAAYWRMVSESKRQARAGKTCQHCGAEFDARYLSRQIFCCRRCARDYHNGLRRPLVRRKPGRVPRAISRTCLHCGDRFDARRVEQIFCSLSCCASFRNRLRLRTRCPGTFPGTL
ncbi:endogenous inhibitor of DNA gyrase (YacG/DUF329 family) [Bradyrhizobium sp. URHC0002]